MDARGSAWCDWCLGDFPAALVNVDHVRPRARGGTDTDGNVQVLCRPCHGLKTATEFGPCPIARGLAAHPPGGPSSDGRGYSGNEPRGYALDGHVKPTPSEFKLWALPSPVCPRRHTS
ncbi:HNH endonuclease [Streptomyces nondiastaticus]